MVDTLGFRRCLLGTVFAALWVVTESYAWERRQLGTLYGSQFHITVIRDELDVTFFRWVLFAGDLAIYAIFFLLAPATLGGIIGNLLTGLMNRQRTLAYTATLVAVTASSVSVVATKISIYKAFYIPWPMIVFVLAASLLLSIADGPAKTSHDGSQLDTTTDPGTAAPTVEPVDGRSYQSPGRGRVLTALGWTLGALAMCIWLIGGPLHENLVSKWDLPFWAPPLIAVAIVVPPVLLLGASIVLLERGRRHRHRIIPSFEELAGERYLLYLRPFAIDLAMALPPDEAPGWHTRSPFELPGTHEQFVIRQFRGLGRIVAIGQPGERLPQLGAERGYLPVGNWQDTVSRLIQGAHAVIMTAAPGPGTLWEFTEALRTTTPSRLLLLVYYDELYHPFREGAAQEYATRSSAEPDVSWPPLPHLPDIPPPAPHAKGLRWDFPLQGILSFDDEWRPRFTRFPPTVPRLRLVWTIRRLVRRELKPALHPVSQLPPVSPLG
ncbi:hypothetical protein ACWCOT_39800 [Nonomuraea bangladeshensis]